jgi:hypothetical protein
MARKNIKEGKKIRQGKQYQNLPPRSKRSNIQMKVKQGQIQSEISNCANEG